MGRGSEGDEMTNEFIIKCKRWMYNMIMQEMEPS